MGFKAFEFYGDVTGSEFWDTGETICGVFTKGRISLRLKREKEPKIDSLILNIQGVWRHDKKVELHSPYAWFDFPGVTFERLRPA